MTDQESITPEIPPDRAGVVKGQRANYPRSYKDGKDVAVTEVGPNLTKKKTLKVAEGRQNTDGKWEYKLKDSSGAIYRGGHWFPESEVKRA